MRRPSWSATRPPPTDVRAEKLAGPVFASGPRALDFHVASISELAGPSVLEYDYALARVRQDLRAGRALRPRLGRQTGSKRQLIATGHSMGGAVTMYPATRFMEEGYSGLHVVTFGGPASRRSFSPEKSIASLNRMPRVSRSWNDPTIRESRTGLRRSRATRRSTSSPPIATSDSS